MEGDQVETYLRSAVKIPIGRLYPPTRTTPGSPSRTPLATATRRPCSTRRPASGSSRNSARPHTTCRPWWRPSSARAGCRSTASSSGHHPDDGDRHVVVEGKPPPAGARAHPGPRAREGAAEAGSGCRPSLRPTRRKQIEEQQALVAHLERIVDDTTDLEVVPINAATIDELEHKLPRVPRRPPHHRGQRVGELRPRTSGLLKPVPTSCSPTSTAARPGPSGTRTSSGASAMRPRSPR